jgi:hypothetical protein
MAWHEPQEKPAEWDADAQLASRARGAGGVPVPTALDSGRPTKKLLRAVVARLLARKP